MFPFDDVILSSFSSMAHLSAEKLSSGAGSTYSLHSLAEGSQAISEAEEIHEVWEGYSLYHFTNRL